MNPELKDYFRSIKEWELGECSQAVDYWSHFYHIDGYSPEDLAQEGELRLWKALDKYDPTKASLNTWAGWVVRNRYNDLLKRDLNKKHGYDVYFIPFTSDSDLDYQVLTENLSRLIELAIDNDVSYEEFV